MHAMLRWLLFLLFILSFLALSNMALFSLVSEEHTRFGTAFVSLFNSKKLLPDEGMSVNTNYSPVQLLLILLNLLVWLVFAVYLVYAIILSTVIGTYKSVQLQHKAKKNVSDLGVNCNCLNFKSSQQKHKNKGSYKTSKQKVVRYWWSTLAWLSSWLPSSVNRKVKQRTEQYKLDEIELLER